LHMSHIQAKIFLTAACCLASLCSPGTPMFGQEGYVRDYIDSARDFLEAARRGLARAKQHCGDVDCSAEFINQMSGLRESADRLTQFLGPPPNMEAIRSEISIASPLVESICNQFGGRCTDLPDVELIKIGLIFGEYVPDEEKDLVVLDG